MDRREQRILSPELPSTHVEWKRNDLGEFAELMYGSKHMQIHFIEGTNEFVIRIDTITDASRIPEETRTLYERAKTIMQEKTNQIQQQTEYELDTANKNMIKFAQTTGNTIFQWDSSRSIRFTDISTGETKMKWLFTRIFYPEKI